MSLIKEIHNQPHGVRLLMWGLSTFAVVGVIGYFWLGSVQREIFVALNANDPAAQQEFIARQDSSSPNLLGMIGNSFGKLTASIGGMLGFESSKGFDRPRQQGTVHMLPLSK